MTWRLHPSTPRPFDLAQIVFGERTGFPRHGRRMGGLDCVCLISVVK